MSTGEIGYDELMHQDKVTAYYKSGFVLLVLLSVVMVILVTNLLIGKDFTCKFFRYTLLGWRI